MKPRHIGFLLVGVALAVGLAVKMTQAPPIPVGTPAPHTVPQVERSAVVSPVVTTPVAKPSPIPHVPLAPPARAAAPQPVYDNPLKPAIRKSRPILMASAKPTQWTPGPYEAPVGPVAPRQQPASIETRAEPPEQKAAPEPRHVALQTGMTIPVRLDESLTSDRTVTGETFQASLVEPFAVDGLVIAERGARVTGRIVNSVNARVELGLATLTTSDGQRVAISTDPWTRLIGSGDALGAGTIIRFRLASRVIVTEQQIAGK